MACIASNWSDISLSKANALNSSQKLSSHCGALYDDSFMLVDGCLVDDVLVSGSVVLMVDELISASHWSRIVFDCELALSLSHADVLDEWFGDSDIKTGSMNSPLFPCWCWWCVLLWCKSKVLNRSSKRDMAGMFDDGLCDDEKEIGSGTGGAGSLGLLFLLHILFRWHLPVGHDFLSLLWHSSWSLSSWSFAWCNRIRFNEVFSFLSRLISSNRDAFSLISELSSLAFNWRCSSSCCMRFCNPSTSCSRRSRKARCAALFCALRFVSTSFFRANEMSSHWIHALAICATYLNVAGFNIIAYCCSKCRQSGKINPVSID